MKRFNDEVLRKIEFLGTCGFSFKNLADELNMTPVQLRAERKNNKKLDIAIRKCEFNAESFYAGAMMRAILSNDKSYFAETYVKIYIYLKEKTGYF